MLEKNKKKPRKTWTGLFVRKTPTKREKELRILKKHKKKGLFDD